MQTNTVALPRYSKARVEAIQASSTCQKCSSPMLVHDYDPHHFHNGITCLACGFEQVLTTGNKSLIDPKFQLRGRPPRLAGGTS